MRVDKQDLEWWRSYWPTLSWTWAKSYAESAPHHYVVRGRNIDWHEGKKVLALIHTFGEPQMFWRSPNLYLVADDRKWWSDWVGECRVINMAPADQFFGNQVAPRTRTGYFGMYDTICTDYDEIAPRLHDDLIVDLLRDRLSSPWPRTLDIGAGTGRLMDLELTAPDRWTVVDSSQGMLNLLLRKHHHPQKGRSVGEVVPGKIEDAYEQFERKSFELVVALYGSASYVDPRVVAKLPLLSSGLTVLMTYKPGYLPEWWKGWPLPETIDEVAEVVRKMGGERFDLGNYDLTILEDQTSLF